MSQISTTSRRPAPAWAMLALAAILGGGGPVARTWADYVFPAWSLTVGSDPQVIALDTQLAPAGTYSGFRVRTNWSPVAVGPWSSEARWQLLAPDLPVPLADSGPANNGANTTDPLTLRWTGSFVQTYVGGSPLSLRAWQNLPTSSAAWNDITITLLSGTVLPPAIPEAADLGMLVAGQQTSTAELAPTEIRWYRFETPAVRAAAGEFLQLDTLGSALVGGEFGDGNDTEIALYNADGLRVGYNDDLDTAAGELLSGLAFGDDSATDRGVRSVGDLAAGTYFLAVAGFDAQFADAEFDVLSTSAAAGFLAVNFTTNVPEPAGGVMVALGVLLGKTSCRRRR